MKDDLADSWPFLGTIDEGEAPLGEVIFDTQEGAEEKALEMLSPTGINPNLLKAMRPRHRAIARAVVQGLRPKEICLRYDLSGPRLSVILASPLFQTYVRTLETGLELEACDVKDDLVAMATQSVDILQEMMDQSSDFDPKLRLELATAVLDRAGFGKNSGAPAPQISNTINIAQLTSEGLRDKVFELIEQG